MFETANHIPKVEDQLKSWVSYLSRGVHSGNRDFDAGKVQKLLEEYKKTENPIPTIIIEAEELLKSHNEWKSTQIKITPDNDYT